MTGDDLVARGRHFWDWIRAEHELSMPETELLLECARTLDVVDALETAIRRDGVMVEGSQGQLRVNPAIAEVRAQRLALGRLLAQLDLPADEGTVESAATLRGRKAAESRWSRHRALRGV